MYSKSSKSLSEVAIFVVVMLRFTRVHAAANIMITFLTERRLT